MRVVLKRLRLVAWLVAVVTIVLLEVVLSTWPEAVPPISNPLSVCAGGGVVQLLLQGRVPVIALAAVVLAMNLKQRPHGGHGSSRRWRGSCNNLVPSCCRTSYCGRHCLSES